MTIFIFTALIVDFGLPVLIGLWIGRSVKFDAAGAIFGAVRGLLIVFAALYVLGLLGDTHQWNTFWPSTTAFHMFGPDWALEALVRAANPFRLAYFLFLTAFGICFFMRLWSAGRISGSYK